MRRFAEEIKSRVTMPEVLARYGIERNRAGKSKCPFHDERTASLGVYAEGTRYKCFGCGESGDVITFIMKLENLTFGQAVIRLNLDFALGLPIGRRETRREREEAQKRMKERSAQRKAKQEKRARYWGLVDKWIDYDKAIREHKPKDINTPIDERYIEAVKNIKYIEYLIDTGDYYE